MKTGFTNRLSLSLTVVTFACLMCSADVQAQDAPSADELDINELETVAVTPIYGAGRHAEEAHQATLAMARANEGLELDGAHLSSLGEGGMGFAGESDKADVLALRVGDALVTGIVKPWEGTVATQLKAIIPKLELSSQTEKQLMEAVNSRIATMSLYHDLVNRLGNAEEENQRTLGYLVAGAWVRFAKVSANNGYAMPGSHIYGYSLAEMVEKDATFGGSDMQLAEALRKIAKGLEKAVDTQMVTEGYQQTLLLTADTEGESSDDS